MTPFPGAVVIAERDDRRPGRAEFTRVRLLRTTFKYPLVRLAETVSVAPGGKERVRRRSVMVGDHVLVKLQPNATVDDLQELNRLWGGEIRRAMHSAGHFLVAFPKADLDTVLERAAAYAAATNVIALAEPDYIVHTSATVLPNDPIYSSLWALPKIRAPEAWSLHTGTGGVVVGVIDTGVDYRHVDLAANMWHNPDETSDNGIDDDNNGFVDDYYGYNFQTDTGDPLDDRDHGTHVSGTIGAIGNNAVGAVGVSWRVRIMALKFIDAAGNGATSDAIDAVHYTTLMRLRGVNIRLTNNSWGGEDDSSALLAAIAAHRDAGMLFIAAAGNEYSNIDQYPHYPAGHTLENIISVANTDQNDVRRSSSNYGAVSVDLAAPGTSILSTMPNDSYATKTGTSMSAAYVTGAAALIWDLLPDLTWQEVRDAIFNGVDSVSGLSGITVTGGRLNVYKALRTLPPHVHHEPLSNTTNALAAIPVEATVEPAGLVASNGVTLHWYAGAPTGTAAEAVLEPGTNHLFRGEIPGQAIGTTVSYYLEARTQDGLVTRDPADAPAVLHTFEVVEPTTLWILGYPGPYDQPEPAYGLHALPLRARVEASVSPFADVTDTHRFRCEGWRGMGSVPNDGSSNHVAFILDGMGALEWRWQSQYALRQPSQPAGIVTAVTWWAESAAATTVAAPEEMSLAGTDWHFVEWQWDGHRLPDATGVAVNPAGPITMSTSRTVVAVYLPSDEDADDDGLADWWERFYFGSLAVEADHDDDLDGYLNLDEYQDRTHPLDAGSFPTGPEIAHTPLDNPQGTPAPWPIRATITDNHRVAGASLRWRHADQSSWRETTLTPGSEPDVYEGAIPAPGVFGYTNEYQITARDIAGYTGETPIYRFFVAYPVGQLTPTGIVARLRQGATTNVTLRIGNGGNTNLAWQLRPAWFDDMERGAVAWTNGGVLNPWTLSSHRTTSGTAAWYCGYTNFLVYPSNLEAWLDTPDLRLGGNARLIFQHWIDCELDSNNPGQTFDAGVVEISTNAGQSFVSIEPEGGYPYVTHPHKNSPWTNTIPCYAGTGGWQQASFNLAAFSNQTVIIRFRFGSDWNTEREGWLIDDVVVVSATEPESWLNGGIGGGSLSGDTATEVTVTLGGDTIATGEQRALLRLVSNDPVTPTNDIPVARTVWSPPHIDLTHAGQTTNGNGWIVISNRLSDADGDACDITWEISLDGAVSWTPPALLAVSADEGALSVSPNGGPQAYGVITIPGGTNQVTAVWASAGGEPPLQRQTGVLARVRAWDGSDWSVATTSMPFMIDNEAPVAPAAISAREHSIGAWSTNNVLALTWSAAHDGDGSGLRGYEYTAGGPMAPTQAVWWSTPATQGLTAPLSPDGSNWWAWVRTVDAVGNTSTATPGGPYYIDTHPPASSNAIVVIEKSGFGDYVIGGELASQWSGFEDSGSGIADYFFARTAASGPTNGQWTEHSCGLLDGASPGVTNTVYVWARDRVGWVGNAAAASVLVLAPGEDFDGDGMMTSDEEVAGTDARDHASTFLVHLDPVASSPTAWVIGWNSVTGRQYDVWRRAMSGNDTWTVLPDHTNRPGTGVMMSYTSLVDSAGFWFYRVTVKP